MDWASWLCRVGVGEWNFDQSPWICLPGPASARPLILGDLALSGPVSSSIMWRWCSRERVTELYMHECARMLETHQAQNPGYPGIHACYTFGNIICASCSVVPIA